MWIKYCFLALIGGSFGFLAAAGVFTVLVAVGLVPRFAGKTHTGKKVILYEEMVIAGTITGCIASVFERYVHVGSRLLEAGLSPEALRFAGGFCLLVFGVFSGMFIGCLALAIAEMLDSIPIFARRVGFRHGMGIAICAMAAGKVCGSLLYFFLRIHDAVQ